MIKISNLIAASVFASLFLFPVTVKAKEHSLVGVQFPPLSEEFEGKGGWVVDDLHIIEQTSKEEQKLLLLGRLVKRNSQGKDLYEVVNVLTLPPIANTEEVIGGSSCFLNGQEDRNLIAIMKSNDNTPYLTNARKVWRVEGEEFKEVNVTSFQIKCENYSYGL